MNYTFRVDFKSHYKNAAPLLYYVLVAISLPILMTWKYGASDLGYFIFGGLGMLIICLSPPLIIHWNYYRINKNDLFEYDPLNQRVTINYKGKDHMFVFGDIVLVERFMSHPFAENRVQYLPWDSYNHSIIHLEDGKRFVITSLLVPNLELPIDSEKIKIKKTWYKLAPRLSNPH